MLTTVWTFSGARPPRNSVFLRRLCALLALDERRRRGRQPAPLEEAAAAK